MGAHALAERAVGRLTSAESAPTVRVDVLRQFVELVTELGGDAEALLARFQLEPATLAKNHALISYRTHVNLLEHAAEALGCPDLGMRLAVLQGGARVLGPLGVAMRNSGTLKEAFRYCAKHVRAFSDATRIAIRTERATRCAFMHFEILVPGLPFQRQAVEHALLLVQKNVGDLSNGQVQAREIWFAHEALSSPALCRAYFGAPVRFGCALNGVMFTEGDLERPVVDGDPQILELATSFIEQRYPPAEPVLSARVRAEIERLLLVNNCTFAEVASALAMHTRTLQRRLRAQGESFEGIKDGVRRDIALRYLRQSSLPLTRITELLGYSETSVLSRSCHRWFAASPRQLRSGQSCVEHQAA